ncbi:MAG: DUF2513 domain-containing protein [Bradyrhizobium sp.]|nr:DUF2513 domain-containing protein [Bradyrhizobium sp.]
MKRDMDVIRSLLMRLEAMNSNPHRVLLIRGGEPELCVDGASLDTVKYHLALLRERGLIEPQEGGTLDGGIYFRRLTWEGHDFVDAVRDEDIWHKTRHGALSAGSWTFDLVKELAKGFIKKQIEQRTGGVL